MYSTVGTPRVVAMYRAETVQDISGSTIVTESSGLRDNISGAGR